MTNCIVKKYKIYRSLNTTKQSYFLYLSQFPLEFTREKLFVCVSVLWKSCLLLNITPPRRTAPSEVTSNEKSESREYPRPSRIRFWSQDQSWDIYKNQFLGLDKVSNKHKTGSGRIILRFNSFKRPRLCCGSFTIIIVPNVSYQKKKI